MKRRSCYGILLLSALLAATGVRAEPQQLIVRLTADAAKSALTPKAQIEKIGARAGVAVTHLRAMALGAQVVSVDARDADRVVAALAGDPAVEFAEVDTRVRPAQAFPD